MVSVAKRVVSDDPPEPAAQRLRLRSGRSLEVVEQDGEELLCVANPDGEVELRVRLTPDGPVLSVEHARLELRATDSIAIEAQRVELRAEERAELSSGGEIALEAQDDVRVSGKTIRLN